MSKESNSEDKNHIDNFWDNPKKFLEQEEKSRDGKTKPKKKRFGKRKEEDMDILDRFDPNSDRKR